MTMTVVTAQTHLDAWLAADLAVAKGKSYSIQGRSLTRVDAETIKSQIAYWQSIVNSLNAEAAGAVSPGIRIAKWS